MSSVNGRMMKLQLILNRLDEKSLTNFLGKSTIATLKVIRPTEIRLSSLVDTIIKNIPVQIILNDPIMRKTIIHSMNEKEAQSLVDYLKIKNVNYPSYSLLNLRVDKTRLKKILEFFEETYKEIPNFVNPDSEEINPQRPLFPHQFDTIVKATKILNSKPHKVLLHMPTGTGKTRSAMRIITTHLLKCPSSLIIWVVHNEELCEQAIDEFTKTWSLIGDRKIKIFRFFGKSKLDPINKVENGFMVAGTQKLIFAARKNNLFLAELAKKTNFVIVDEGHRVTAKESKDMIEELIVNKNTKLLGLSATPGRVTEKFSKDNLDLVKFFGNKKVMLYINKKNPIKFLIDNGYLAKPTFNTILNTNKILSAKALSSLRDNFDIPQAVLEQLSKDVNRNLLILNEIKKLERTHKKIIVFASTIQHAKDISILLSMDGMESHYITTHTPTNMRAEILDKYKNSNTKMILCNYGILTMGFDAPKTSAVVIARPTKSHVLYTQMIGRAMRGEKAGGNKTCEISTIADEDIEYFVDITKLFEQWDELWND